MDDIIRPLVYRLNNPGNIIYLLPDIVNPLNNRLELIPYLTNRSRTICHPCRAVFHYLHGFVRCPLDSADFLLDILSSRLGLCRQLAHLLCHYRKALACFTSTGSLNSRIQ